MVLAVKKFRVYLGKGFDIITDHQALRWLKSLDPENETGKRGRWLEFLQQFDMKIIPKKGKSPTMRIADYLSRVKCDGDIEDGESNVMVVNSTETWEPENQMYVNREDIAKAQNLDDGIRIVKEALDKNLDLNPGGAESRNWRKQSISGNKLAVELWRYKERLSNDADGVLRLRFNGGKRTKENPFGTLEMNRIVIPSTYSRKIMELVHRSATAAHMGMRRTWQRARNHFWWPGMKKDLEDYVAQCEECGNNKHVNNPNKAPCTKTSIPGKPLEEIMIDFLGPFQQARTHQYRYILQIQDVFSRYIVFVPCRDSTAITASMAVMERWICLFGISKKLRSVRSPHIIA